MNKLACKIWAESDDKFAVKIDFFENLDEIMPFILSPEMPRNFPKFLEPFAT